MNIPRIDADTFTREFLNNDTKVELSIYLAEDLVEYHGMCSSPCSICPFSQKNLSDGFTHDMFVSRNRGEDLFLARCAEEYLRFIRDYRHMPTENETI